MKPDTRSSQDILPRAHHVNTQHRASIVHMLPLSPYGVSFLILQLNLYLPFSLQLNYLAPLFLISIHPTPTNTTTMWLPTLTLLPLTIADNLTVSLGCTSQKGCTINSDPFYASISDYPITANVCRSTSVPGWSSFASTETSHGATFASATNPSSAV